MSGALFNGLWTLFTFVRSYSLFIVLSSSTRDSTCGCSYYNFYVDPTACIRLLLHNHLLLQRSSQGSSLLRKSLIPRNERQLFPPLRPILHCPYIASVCFALLVYPPACLVRHQPLRSSYKITRNPTWTAVLAFLQIRIRIC